jgi:hypothetical protein
LDLAGCRIGAGVVCGVPNDDELRTDLKTAGTQAEKSETEKFRNANQVMPGSIPISTCHDKQR